MVSVVLFIAMLYSTLYDYSSVEHLCFQFLYTMYLYIKNVMNILGEHVDEFVRCRMIES